MKRNTLTTETVCPDSHGQHSGVELQQCNGLTPPLIIPAPEQPLGAEDSTAAQCSRRADVQVYAGGLYPVLWEHEGFPIKGL